jgi:hypothetical protein
MNDLHAMLLAGSYDAQPVIGGPFQFQNKTFTGTFSEADEKLLMELAGYLDEADMICVAPIDQFALKGVPLPNTGDQLVFGIDTYAIKGRKVDLSAVVLVLKKIST